MNIIDDIILDYLIENVNPDLIKQYNIKEMLLLDYCYNKNQRIPKDYFKDSISRIIIKEEESSKNLQLDETKIKDCIFLEAYKKLLSNKTRNLIKEAKTKEDYKTIASIDKILEKAKIPNSILRSEKNLKLKLSDIAKEYLKINSIGKTNDKLENRINKLNRKYNKIKNAYEERLWNNCRRINKLISLRNNLKELKGNYSSIAYVHGIKVCNSLERKMKKSIKEYNYVQDLKQELKEIKNEIFVYDKEVSEILKDNLCLASINKINRIYSNLNKLSKKRFLDITPAEWIEDYYLNIEKINGNIHKKCKKKVETVLKRSNRYRKNIDNSFFSIQTKKNNDKLKKYNKELKIWAKCQAI